MAAILGYQHRVRLVSCSSGYAILRTNGSMNIIDLVMLRPGYVPFPSDSWILG